MEGRRKVILIVITVALLLALIPLVTNNNLMTVATPTPQQSATQTTPKQPTIDNLTQQYLSVSLSAIENSTDVVAASMFNEAYFNLTDPTSLPGLMSAQVGIQAHILAKGLNLTAPHTSYLFGPYGSIFFGPFGYNSLNQTIGVVMVQINGSDIEACNQTLQLISEEFIQEASSIGIDLRPVATQFYPMFYPASPNQATMGLSIMTSLNDSATAYDILESLIPEGCLAKTIATKPSDERYIVLAHSPSGTSWRSWVQVGMVIENQTVKNGDTYTYSLRRLLEPSNNITIKGPATISVNLPATSKIMSTYGFYQGWGTQPSLSYSEYSGDVNIEDLNVIYTLESSVPYVVAEYDMSDWNMDPGDTGKLYLTLRNVGTSAAYNISGSVSNWYPQIINFMGAPWGPSSWASFYIDEMGVGESIVLEFDFEAISPGKSTIHIGYNWRRDPNGLTTYNSWMQFDFKIGIPGPLLVTYTSYSDWVLNPNDAVSAITTIRNVGNEDATNVTVMGIPLGPALGTVIDSNVTLPGFDNPIMSVGDISAGSSFTMNVTYRNDMGFFGSVHTGGSVGLAGFQLLYDGAFSQGIMSLPLLLPGVRPPEAIYFEFEKTPEVVSVEPGDQVTVSVKLKNLGLTEQPFFVTDLYPEDVFELVDGNNTIGVTIESGEVVTMTYTLEATASATLRLPSPAIGSNYTWVLTAEKILGAPLEEITDTTPPVTTIEVEGALGQGGWYASNVTVSLTAVDDLSGVAETLYSYDGNTWYSYTAPLVIADEGVTTVYYRSVDNAGNVEETKSVTMRVDKTSPTTELAFRPSYVDGDGNIYVTCDTEFTLTAGDPVSGVDGIYYRINGGDWTAYSEPFTLPEGSGTIVLEYYSVDVAGNLEPVKSETVTLVSLEVSSYMTDGEGNTLTYFDLVFSKYRSEGYKLVATNPGQMFYNVEIINNWPIGVDTLTINLSIPEDFALKGAVPIHVYLNGEDVTELCIIDGTTITLQNVPIGGTVYVYVHLDYALKGTLYGSLDDFEMRSYTFGVSVSASGGSPTPPGEGLTGEYASSANLITHQKKTTAIAGFVTDADGNPVVNATVELYDSSGNLVGTALTDENGFYYFVEVEAAEYTLRVIYNEKTVTVAKGELAQVDFVI
ncbi:MAG: OmpL47-type beta-barrel domain-containing protein [Candidatus Freyarchaeota archaeon]